MIHPGLAALKHWDKESTRRATAPGSRRSRTPKPPIIAGGVDGKTLTRRLLSRLATNRLQPRAGNTTLKIPGAISSIQGKRRGLTGVPFEKERTEPWKEGWIAVDIKLGMLAEREPN